MYSKISEFYSKDLGKTYVFNGYAGADSANRLNVRVIAKKAWQYHFCRNMFINIHKKELNNFSPDFTIINASDVINEDFENDGMNSLIFNMFTPMRVFHVSNI